MISIFTDKNLLPTTDDLKTHLAETYPLWQAIADYVFLKYPNAIEEWSFSTYGWSLRLKDKKRAIIYLLPRDRFFKVAFVFGQKATDVILKSQIADSIKTELQAAKVYAEGRGIRIEIKDELLLNDILELIDCKLAH